MTADTDRRIRRAHFPILAVLTLSVGLADPVFAQPAPPPSRIVIPSLANDSRPSELDFQGGECEIDPAGRTMECEFQQVFLTPSPFDTQTCLVTTNRYARTFEKLSDAVWISREGPDGECGIVDVATLRDEGNAIRWSLELRKTATARSAAACRGEDPPAEVLSWRNARRPLPCRFVQPGAVR